MEITALWNGNGTATTANGKLYITGSVNEQFQGIDIPLVNNLVKYSGTNGTSRQVTITPVNPANNTEYRLALTLLKNEIYHPFGPAVDQKLFVYTSDASASVTEIVHGLASAIVPGLLETSASGSANGLTVTKSGATTAWTALVITTANTASFDFKASSLVGSLLTVNNSTAAYVAPQGKGSDLVAQGITDAVSGTLYTVYKGFAGKPVSSGFVSSRIDNVPVTLYCAAGSTVIAALDNFIAAPFASPGAYDLDASTAD
jgi:hypothetical protein